MPHLDLQQRYEKWQKEFTEVHDKWNKFGLLKQIKTKQHRRQLAMILENQRLINEQDQANDGGDNWIARFKRISIPLVRRVYGDTPFTQWVGIQAMLQPTDLLRIQEGGELFEIGVQARTRKLKTEWPVFKEEEQVKYAYALDYEAEKVAVTGLDLADEISREVLTDLSKNCQRVNYTSEPEHQLLVINNIFKFTCEDIAKNVGHEANWCVVSPLMLEELESNDAYNFVRVDKPLTHGLVYLAGVKHVTLDNKMVPIDVYCNCHELQHPTQILFGYKGEEHETGYYYMPYVPFTLTPVTLDPNTFEPHVGIITRYFKYLRPGVGKYYYRLVEIDDVVFPQERNKAEEGGPLGPGTVIILQKRELDVDPSGEHPEHSGPGELVPESEQQPELSGVDCGEGCGDPAGDKPAADEPVDLPG